MNIIDSIIKLFHSKDNLNIKNIDIKNLKYMLIFPLAPVFANMQEILFSNSFNFMGLDAMTLMGSAYCVGAGILFALTKIETFARFSNILAAVTAFSFILWNIMPNNKAGLIMSIIFTGCLGGCAGCASFAYTFILNNVERFIGASLISLFFALNQLDYGFSLISGLFPKSYLTVLVIGTCICLSLYKKSDFSYLESRQKADFNPAIGLMLYFFVAHYFVEIFYTYMPEAASSEAMISNGSVGILAIILAVVLQFITKRSVWNMCNLFFIAMILTYSLSFISENSIFRNVAFFMHGFEQIGYIVSYYLLGCVFKKYGDFRTFKFCIVTILPVSMIFYMIPGSISAYAHEVLPLVAMLVSLIVFIVFIMMSPAYSRYLFFADWADDFYCVDMTENLKDEEKSDIFEHLGLSPREKEVASLLLKGKNAKQIAEVLEISIHTVNFHIKNIYKKLNVGNRAEFFARFGGLLPVKE